MVLPENRVRYLTKKQENDARTKWEVQHRKVIRKKQREILELKYMSEMNNTIVSTTDLNKQKKEVNPNTNHLKLYRGGKKKII